MFTNKAMTIFRLLVVACVAVTASNAFVTGPSAGKTTMTTSLSMASNGDEEQSSFRIRNPFKEMGDMFASLDDVIDDFLFKKMGNGEVFYGKRKYKPSGNVEDDYNGFGLSDSKRIDVTRENKELWLEEKRRKEEARRNQ